jgi:hypothetical protein
MPYIKIDETTVPAAGKRIPKQENCLLFLTQPFSKNSVTYRSKNNVNVLDLLIIYPQRKTDHEA